MLILSSFLVNEKDKTMVLYNGEEKILLYFVQWVAYDHIWCDYPMARESPLDPLRKYAPNELVHWCV